MFTGIVEECGEIVEVLQAVDHGSARYTIRGEAVTSDAARGDSISVNGVCLTVTDLRPDMFTTELMAETLARTTAGSWAPGVRVNLERSVTPTTRMGGHLVQGHVDGVGTVVERVEHDGYDDVSIAVPASVGEFIAPKGAVAVDGISLTVIDVIDADSGTVFTLGVIPETRRATTMGDRTVGDAVNIEVDVMAKYARRLLAPQLTGQEAEQ